MLSSDVITLSDTELKNIISDGYPNFYYINLANYIQLSYNASRAGMTVIDIEAEYQHMRSQQLEMVLKYIVIAVANGISEESFNTPYKEPPSWDDPYSTGNGLEKDGLGKLSGNTYKVTRQGIDAIGNHLNSTGMASAENSAMINRLENALLNGHSITGADASFYLHELKEASLMQSGMLYENAHQAALNYYNVSPFSVYDPSVIQEFIINFNQNWLNFWGIN